MKGLVLIPDISGFTDFVKGVELNLGVSIIQQLLNEIIDNNELGLELSEIEGDAILFFKGGQPVPLNKVFEGLKKMREAFDHRYLLLKAEYNLRSTLSLKFILHYGEINVYHIRGFKKLYGQTVIESHRLLKNGSRLHGYTLITEDYVRALGDCTIHYIPGKGYFPSFFTQLFTGLREIGFYFFNAPRQGINQFEYSLQ